MLTSRQIFWYAVPARTVTKKALIITKKSFAQKMCTVVKSIHPQKEYCKLTAGQVSPWIFAAQRQCEHHFRGL